MLGRRGFLLLSGAILSTETNSEPNSMTFNAEMSGPEDWNMRYGYSPEPVVWSVSPITGRAAQGVTAMGSFVAGGLTGSWNGTYATLYGHGAGASSLGAYCLTANGLNAAQHARGVYILASGADALKNHADPNGDSFTAVGAKAALNAVGGRGSVVMGTWACQAGVVINETTAIGEQVAYNFPFSAEFDGNTFLGCKVAYNGTGGRMNTFAGHDSGNVARRFDCCSFYGRGSGRESPDGTVLSSALGYNANVTGNFQIQLGGPGTTPFAWAPLQVRSDARDKADVREYPVEKAKALVLDADWKEYRYAVRGQEEGKRYHGGVLAQNEHARLEKRGIDASMIQHHAKNGGADVWSVGYEGYIPAIAVVLQDMAARLEKLERENAELKAKLG